MQWSWLAGALLALCIVAAIPYASGAEAAVNTPQVQLGFADTGQFTHGGTYGDTDPTPGCEAAVLGPGLTFRFHAASLDRPVPVTPPADCSIIPHAGAWGAAFVDPNLGFGTGPCFYGEMADPVGARCDPTLVRRDAWRPTAFNCTPTCSTKATSIHAESRLVKDTREQAGLLVTHDLRLIPGEDRFIEVETTFTNTLAVGDITGIEYRRTIPATELPATTSPCQNVECDAKGTYTKLTFGGDIAVPEELACMSAAAYGPVAPDETDCLLPAANVWLHRNVGGLPYCHDDGRPPGPKLAGPGRLSGPLLDWSDMPREHLDCAQGILWQLDVGDLAPGQSRRFSIVLGAIRAGTYEAEAAVRAPAVAADIWAIAAPATMDPSRDWATLAVGLKGLEHPRPAITWTAPTPGWVELLPAFVEGISACAGDPVEFSAAAAPTRNALATASWSFGDGTTANYASTLGTPTHSFDAPGSYTVTLDVVDDHGWPTQALAQVQVLSCAVAPLAHILSIASAGTCTDTLVHLAADGIDPDGGAVSYVWEFGDGTSAAGSIVTHQYLADGPRIIRLTVTDDDAPTSRSTTVEMAWESRAEYNCLPELAVPVHHLRAPVGTTFAFTALATDLDDVPTIHVNLGPPGATLSLAPAPGGTAGDFQWTTTRDTPVGTYLVSLTATDGKDNALRTVDLVLNVLPAGSPDADHDGVADTADNCGAVVNRDQADTDRDGLGDSCQSDFSMPRTAPAPGPASDLDRDGVQDLADNCVNVPNVLQTDSDADGAGDACDRDVDGDGVPESIGSGDNCPTIANANQADANRDGLGDACQLAAAVEPAGPAVREVPTLRARSAPETTGAALPLALGLALGVILALLASRVWRSLWLVLFSRLGRSTLLQHPLRARLLQLIEAEPGIHVLEAARRLGGRRGTIHHHVNALRAAGLLQAVQAANRLQLYPPGPLAAEPSVLERLNEAVRTEPGLSVSMLCSKLGVSHGAATYHLRRMEAQGRVQMSREGRRVLVFPGA